MRNQKSKKTKTRGAKQPKTKYYITLEDDVHLEDVVEFITCCDAKAASLAQAKVKRWADRQKWDNTANGIIDARPWQIYWSLFDQWGDRIKRGVFDYAGPPATERIRPIRTVTRR